MVSKQTAVLVVKKVKGSDFLTAKQLDSLTDFC